MKRVGVLVADDNKAMLQFVVSMLAADFDVIQAVNDGAAAVATARRLLPDVAILDISMPGLNGIETARRIKEESHGTAVVFLTIHSDLDICAVLVGLGVSELWPQHIGDRSAEFKWYVPADGAECLLNNFFAVNRH